MRQGPIAHIWVSEVSLGHARSAKKVAQAALSWQFRVPFTVRTLTLELRDSLAGNSTSIRKQPSKGKRIQGSKLLLNSCLRLLLGLLPKIPVRIKQLTVKHHVSVTKHSLLQPTGPLPMSFGNCCMCVQATGFLLDIPRVEVLINSSRLSSKLIVDVKLLPIKAVLHDLKGNACILPHHAFCMIHAALLY